MTQTYPFCSTTNATTLITHLTHRYMEGLTTLTLGTINRLYAHLTLSIDRACTFYHNGFPTPLPRYPVPLENCSAASVPAIGPMRAPTLLPYPTPLASPMDIELAPPLINSTTLR